MQDSVESGHLLNSAHQANVIETQKGFTFSTIPSSPVWRTFLTIAPAFPATV